MFGDVGLPDILVILVIAVFIFGPSKLPARDAAWAMLYAISKRASAKVRIKMSKRSNVSWSNHFESLGLPRAEV